MPTPVEVVPVEVDQLRELLTVDRSLAGEARPSQSHGPLATATYHMPLRVKVKRRWRSDRRLRIASLTAPLLAAAAAALFLLAPWGDTATLVATSETPSVSREAKRVASVAGSTSKEPATKVTHERQPGLPTDHTRVQVESEPAAEDLALPVRQRLQRADLWLRVGTPRGAREARRFLESALAERPRSAHGQAALAEACLRLGDQECATQAIQTATELRPWRGGYRVLARKIDASF